MRVGCKSPLLRCTMVFAGLACGLSAVPAAASIFVQARADTQVDQRPLTPFAGALANSTSAIGSASASATLDKKGAEARVNIVGSDLSGVTATQYANVLQGRVGGVDFVGTADGVYRESSSSALHVDRLVRPTGVSSAFATAGVFFDRSLSAALVPDAAVVSSYVQGFASARGIVDRDTPLELRLGSVLVDSGFEVRFTDLSNNANNALFSVYSTRTADLWVATTLNDLAAGRIETNVVETAVNGTSVSVFDVAGNAEVSNPFEVPVADPLVASSAYVATLPFFLRAGRAYEMQFALHCRIGVSDAAAFMPGTGGECNADRSGYWNGFVAATDEQGNAIPVPDFDSESGFNYRLASPLSPAAPVPEPGTWALLLAGLGLLGAAARRRRPAHGR